jgi:2-polyprenyl-3-methyl-5-hydroxy-6-metoxy-1,4-benzoquinol methylase
MAAKQFGLARCNRCGLLYLKPVPVANDVKRSYSEEYYIPNTFGKLASVTYLTLRAKRIIRLMKQKANTSLDIGCGEGSFMSILRRFGLSAVGIDISSAAVRLASQKKLMVLCCSLQECQFEAASFEVVTLWHVLEHLEKPLNDLRKIRRLIRNGGILGIAVPNSNSLQFKIFRENWIHLDIPRHIYHFSPETLRAITAKSGFRLVKFATSFEDPVDFYHSFMRSLGIENYRLPKILQPALLALTLMSLPPTLLLNLFRRGSVIEAYLAPVAGATF